MSVDFSVYRGPKPTLSGTKGQCYLSVCLFVHNLSIYFGLNGHLYNSYEWISK